MRGLKGQYSALPRHSYFPLLFSYGQTPLQVAARYANQVADEAHQKCVKLMVMLLAVLELLPALDQDSNEVPADCLASLRRALASTDLGMDLSVPDTEIKASQVAALTMMKLLDSGDARTCATASLVACGSSRVVNQGSTWEQFYLQQDAEEVRSIVEAGGGNFVFFFFTTSHFYFL